MSVPVVDDEDHLLGIIQSDTWLKFWSRRRVKMSRRCLHCSHLNILILRLRFIRILYQRGYILLALFIAQSFSSTIMQAYRSTLRLWVAPLLYDYAY